MIATVFATTGCVLPKQYRTDYAPCQVIDQQKTCEKHSVEQHQPGHQNDYTVSFIEFDDQGWLWDREQLEKTMEFLDSKEHQESGAIMLVFVHGWKHNASFEDANVAEFRKMLARISRSESIAAKAEHRMPRKVAGIYLGWRGNSVPGEYITNLSFWERKNVASTVGHSSVTEALVEIERIKLRLNSKKTAAPTRLIVVGHSFGGQIVYTALSQIMIDRLSDPDDSHVFGDLVVMVNPAFEASRYTPLLEASKDWTYPEGQPPLITIFTAENDTATSVWFPTGRRISTFFEKYRDRAQERANTKAIGHFMDYKTHELTLSQRVEGQPEKPTTPEIQTPEAVRGEAMKDLKVTSAIKTSWGSITKNRGWSVDFDGVTLKHTAATLQPNNPLYVVYVKDKAIIDGHSGIWTDQFSDFLRRFILLSVKASE